MTTIEFGKSMAFLGACIGKDIPALTVEAWYLILGDLDVATFQHAVIEVVRGHKFAGLPSAGLIRQAAGVSGGVIDADAAAILGWSTVVKAMREVGGYRSIRWDDPCIAPAIDSIGESWAALCEKPAAELHTWTKKAFVEAYKASRAAGDVHERVSVGIIAQNAGRLGFEKPEPIALGDAPKAVYGFEQNSVRALPGPATASMLTFGEMPPADEDSDEPDTDEEFEARRQRGLKMLSRMIDRSKVEAAYGGTVRDAGLPE